jgi:hypothetical protein
MKNRLIRVLLVLFVLPGLMALFAGCGSACEDLANKICDCQPTRAKIDRCKINVDTATRNMDLSDEQEDRCQAILDSGLCTCEALEQGDFASCGLAAMPSVDVTD